MLNNSQILVNRDSLNNVINTSSELFRAISHSNRTKAKLEQQLKDLSKAIVPIEENIDSSERKIAEKLKKN